MRRKQVLKALPYLVVTLGLVVGATGFVTARNTTTITRPGGAVESPLPATPVVRVAKLTRRIPAHLLVVARTPLTPAEEQAVVKATGATASLSVSAGRVTVEKGQTTALGVDPSRFRAWTPKGTAESDPLWQSVVDGDASVAHVVARAFEIPVGGDLLTQATFPVRLRVGSLATTALPGVGLVVGTAGASELGLQPRTGLLLSVPQRDAKRSATLASRALGSRASVEAVLYDTPAVAAPGGWNVPVVGRITSGFGQRLHPIKQVVTFHDGIDAAAPLGTPVYAMSDGVVLYAGPARGFGNQIVLSHKGGVTTVYGHMSRLLVTSGPVKARQPIALVGNEGDSTGPHLHFEVRVDDRAVDPIAWLRARGVRF